jgi:arylamine N-acetyltransferase
MSDSANSEPKLSSKLLTRILTKLDLMERPAHDLAGLNRVYAAYCGHVPNDNIQKRIWLTGNQTEPVTGGDPIEFFENWLAHGTGGTCFPTAGGFCELLRALGFDANRVSGSVILEGVERDGNHGSVQVHMEGVDYLLDTQHASFTALPIIPGQPSSTGDGIHDNRAVPIAGGFELHSFPGSNRQTPLRIQFDLDHWRVDHNFFLRHYALSALPDRKRSPFNHALFISRSFPGSIVIVGRGNKIVVSSDNSVTKSEITIDERNRILIEELEISEEITHAIPPDEEGGFVVPR